MEGTAAHDVAAICLSKDQHPGLYVGSWWHSDGEFVESQEAGGRVLVTQEMSDAVVVYLNAVSHEQARSKDAELYVEKGFVLQVDSAEDGEVFGTNDAMVYHPSTGRLVVFDYKHGVGVSVSAEDNAQLKFYAAGAVLSNTEWRIAELELVIVQPRSRDNGFLPEDVDPELKRGIRRWPMDPMSLLDFQVDVDDAIARAKAAEPIIRSPDNDSLPVLSAGSWCKWCDAAAVCPEKERQALRAATLAFDDITEVTAAALPEPKTMDAERLAEALKGVKIVSDWLSQIQEYVEALVLSGQSVPGWKAVEKIGRAKWVSGDEEVASYAEMMFGIEENDLRPRKLVTIGEAEKQLKAAGAAKSDIDDFKLRFTIKESSGLTIAPESDKRPAANAADRAFGDIAI